MSDSDILKDISDDLRYYIKETVANSVYKNADDPSPGGGGGGGGGGGALVVNVVIEGSIYTLDKTFSEIKSAYSSGLVIVKTETDYSTSNALVIALNEVPDDEFPSYAVTIGTQEQFSTYEVDGYPSYENFGG